MSLVGRVIAAADSAALEDALRSVVDGKPIGPVSIAMSGEQVVLMYDTAVASTLISGTNAAVGTTAAPISTTPSVGRELIIQADASNGGANVLVGGVSGQYLALASGASLALDWVDISTVWVKASAGTLIVNWLVRG